jgi:hypothetical protein
MNFLNQIFLSSKITNEETNIDDLLLFFEPYMNWNIEDIPIENMDVIKEIQKHEIQRPEIQKHEIQKHEIQKHEIQKHEIRKQEIQRPEMKNRDKFCPRKEDSLFWSIFIAKYGYKEFLVIGNKYHNRELEEKQKIVDFMKKILTSKNDKKIFLQNNKITNVFVQEVMSDLLTNKKTTLKTATIICIYYNIHLFLVNEQKKTFIEFNIDGENAIIYIDDKNAYNVDLNVSADKRTKFTTDYILIEYGDKPLKSVSSYKTADLEIIATKLDINIYSDVKKWKKSELYDLITKKIA